MSDTETDSEEYDMLAADQARNDFLEGIHAVLKQLVNRPPPQVRVEAPSVTMQAPPAAAVNVMVPAPPKKWTVEIIERDFGDRIRKFTITAS